MKLKRMIDEYQLAQSNYNKFKLPDDLARMDALYNRMIERDNVLVEALKNIMWSYCECRADSSKVAENALITVGEDL